MTNQSTPPLSNKIKPPLFKFFEFINTHRIMIIVLLLFLVTLFYEKFAISVLLLVILLFYEQFTKNEYTIKPFEVPEQLAKDGFTGQVITNQIIDKIHEIKSESLTPKELAPFSNSDSESVPEIVVPGAGISIKPILRYFRNKFSRHKPIEITGEMMIENNLIHLTIRITDAPSITFEPVEVGNLLIEDPSNDKNNLQYLTLQAAIYICRHTQPYILACYYDTLTKYDESLKIVNEIVRDKNSKDKAWAYTLWGFILHGDFKDDEAIEKYKLAIDEDPEFSIAHSNLGNIYMKRGEMSKAIESLEKAIKFNPEYALAYNNLGNIYMKRGDNSKADNSKAKEYLEEAINLEPELSLPYSNMGVLYMDEGDKNKAIEYCEKAIELDDKKSNAYNTLGVVYGRCGEAPEAKECYEKAIELDATNSLAYYNLAQSYRDEEDYSKAKEMYEKVIEIDPDGFGKEAREKIENLPK